MSPGFFSGCAARRDLASKAVAGMGDSSTSCLTLKGVLDDGCLVVSVLEECALLHHIHLL